MSMNIFLGMMLMVMIANHAQNEASKPPVLSKGEVLEQICEDCMCEEDCECLSCVYETIPTLTLSVPLAFEAFYVEPRQ